MIIVHIGNVLIGAWLILQLLSARAPKRSMHSAGSSETMPP